MAEALGAHAQDRLDALTLQLAPTQQGRRALLKPSEALVDVVVRERNTFDPLQAPLEVVHARRNAFEQRV
jgi:hypothetical protein